MSNPSEVKHPCFQKSACGSAARVHLPVAPACNTACNFCNRKYDCPNEGRPGVSSALLRPEDSVAYIEQVRGRVPLSVVGIAGPGDPLANPGETFAAFRAVRKAFPDVALCMATNGLVLPDYVEDLKEAGLGHITVTVNAVTPETGAKVYRWVRRSKKVLRGEAGASLMLENQIRGIRLCRESGMLVKVNMVLIPGINDHEAEKIAGLARSLGAELMNILPMIPLEDTPFSHIVTPEAAAVSDIRGRCGEFLRQMTHCKRCRADAAGTLTKDLSPEEVTGMLRKAAEKKDRPRIAVASREGVLINQHLGEAERFLVYELDGERPVFLEERSAPVPGGESRRWEDLAELLRDCRTVAVSGIGQKPAELLSASGLDVKILSGTLGEAVSLLLTGGDCSHLAVTDFRCRGTGENCA